MLIPLLTHEVDIESYHPEFDEDLAYNMHGYQWMQAFQRYLSGIGHPEDEMFASLQQPGHSLLRETFRATMFLRAITGSGYLPRVSGDNEDATKIRVRCILRDVRNMTADSANRSNSSPLSPISTWFDICYTCLVI